MYYYIFLCAHIEIKSRLDIVEKQIAKSTSTLQILLVSVLFQQSILCGSTLLVQYIHAVHLKQVSKKYINR